MSKTHTPSAADSIMPLTMNGLHGRMLRLKAPKGRSREILLIYGHHSSIERMLGLAEHLHQFGGVTLPDLPGFGGMESFYKIGEKPTIDALADYLAAFVKLRYKNRRFTIAAMSLGFVIATRMLQKYPELAKKVDLFISIVGMVHKKDFRFKKHNYYLLKSGAHVLSYRLPALFFRHIVLWPRFIRVAYNMGGGNVNHPKFRDMSKDEYQKMIDFEIQLWHCNDVRTYAFTSIEMFTMNLCNHHVDLPIYHISVEGDRYFDNVQVEQHMRMIFNDFILVPAQMEAHAPTVIASAEEAAPLIPPKIRTMLRKKPS